MPPLAAVLDTPAPCPPRPGPNAGTVPVTFVLPAGIARHAELIAEFTGWNPLAMDRGPDGRHTLTVRLPAGSRWGYQFVVEDGSVVNDPAAEHYAVRPDGSYVSVVAV